VYVTSCEGVQVSDGDRVVEGDSLWLGEAVGERLAVSDRVALELLVWLCVGVVDIVNDAVKDAL